MGTGAITQYVDVAQLVLYLFWAFFIGLVFYLQRESKREGFPLESPLPNGDVVKTKGLIAMPSPKTFLLPHGGSVTVPNDKNNEPPLHAAPAHPWNGTPLEPTGNPMLDGVGPGAFANRADTPDLTYDGEVKLVPLRTLPDYNVSSKDTDPRGLDVVGADGNIGGRVRDLWVDRSEMLFRYLEVSVPLNGGGTRDVLLPITFCKIRKYAVDVDAILAAQFAHVPTTRHAERITLLEEEKIAAYYGGGTLYAAPGRADPLL
jgi:photosynthetic reaction center H subunit